MNNIYKYIILLVLTSNCFAFDLFDNNSIKFNDKELNYKVIKQYNFKESANKLDNSMLGSIPGLGAIKILEKIKDNYLLAKGCEVFLVDKNFKLLKQVGGSGKAPEEFDLMISGSAMTNDLIFLKTISYISLWKTDLTFYKKYLIEKDKIGFDNQIASINDFYIKDNYIYALISSTNDKENFGHYLCKIRISNEGRMEKVINKILIKEYKIQFNNFSNPEKLAKSLSQSYCKIFAFNNKTLLSYADDDKFLLLSDNGEKEEVSIKKILIKFDYNDDIQISGQSLYNNIFSLNLINKEKNEIYLILIDLQKKEMLGYTKFPYKKEEHLTFFRSGEKNFIIYSPEDNQHTFKEIILY